MISAQYAAAIQQSFGRFRFCDRVASSVGPADFGPMVEKATLVALFAAAFASGSRHSAAPEPQTVGAAAALILELMPLDDASDHADTVTYDGVVYAARRLSRRQLQEEGHYLHPGSAAFYQCIIIITGLVSMAGLMAGCTMGVLSLDPVRLKLLRLQGSDEEKRWAKAVLPVLAAKSGCAVSG